MGIMATYFSHQELWWALDNGICETQMISGIDRARTQRDSAWVACPQDGANLHNTASEGQEQCGGYRAQLVCLLDSLLISLIAWPGFDVTTALVS